MKELAMLHMNKIIHFKAQMSVVIMQYEGTFLACSILHRAHSFNKLLCEQPLAIHPALV